jgi:hypothetical protein
MKGGITMKNILLKKIISVATAAALMVGATAAVLTLSLNNSEAKAYYKMTKDTSAYYYEYDFDKLIAMSDEEVSAISDEYADFIDHFVISGHQLFTLDDGLYHSDAFMIFQEMPIFPEYDEDYQILIADFLEKFGGIPREFIANCQYITVSPGVSTIIDGVRYDYIMNMGLQFPKKYKNYSLQRTARTVMLLLECHPEVVRCGGILILPLLGGGVELPEEDADVDTNADTNTDTKKDVKDDFVKGDVNGDKKLTSEDATSVLIKYAEALNNDKTLKPEDMPGGDFNGDGKVDSLDATAILIDYAEWLIEQ